MEINIEELLDQAEDGYLIPCRDGAGNIDYFAKNSCGDTLLHVAVGRNRVEEVIFLIGIGLDVDACGDFMETPLHLAARKGHVKVFEELLSRGSNPELRDASGRRPHDTLADALSKRSPT